MTLRVTVVLQRLFSRPCDKSSALLRPLSLHGTPVVLFVIVSLRNETPFNFMNGCRSYRGWIGARILAGKSLGPDQLHRLGRGGGEVDADAPMWYELLQISHVVKFSPVYMYPMEQTRR